MGTSSPYPGPTGRTPLLPPWAEDPPDDADEPPEVDSGAEDNWEKSGEPVEIDLPSMVMPDVAWSAPKTALTRWATAGGNAAGSLRPVGRAYVAASGGSRRAAEAARSGRASTARLSGFLASGLRSGFEQAAENAGLQDVVGRDAPFVLASIVELLAPSGSLREEAEARVAMIDTLAELFDRYDVATAGVAALDALDENGVRQIIMLYVANYINARFQQELVSRIERDTVSERQANGLLAQIKDFIAGIVRLDLQEINVLTLDWQGPAGRTVVARNYQAAYSLLGDES